MSLSCNPEAQGSQPTFAFLSNTKNNTGETSVVNLDTIQMSYSLFMYLFYNTSTKNFYINDSNSEYCALNFNNFTINGNAFSLVDLFLSTWESNTQNNRNSLFPFDRISIVKYLSKYKNVTNVLPYIVSLSMEDLINTLMDNMVIQESNKIDSAAKITVILSSNIYLPNLSLPITFNLPVSTSLPGYENVFHNNALSFVPQVPLTSEVPVSASIEISNNYSLEEINNYSLEEMQSNEPVIENNYQGIRLNSLVNLSGDISGDDSLDGIDTTHNW